MKIALETESHAEAKQVSEMVLRFEWCFKDQKILAHVSPSSLLYFPKSWVLSSLCRWETWAQSRLKGPELLRWRGGENFASSLGLPRPQKSLPFHPMPYGSVFQQKYSSIFLTLLAWTFKVLLILIKKAWQENQLNSYPVGVYLVYYSHVELPLCWRFPVMIAFYKLMVYFLWVAEMGRKIRTAFLLG